MLAAFVVHSFKGSQLISHKSALSSKRDYVCAVLQMLSCVYALFGGTSKAWRKLRKCTGAMGPAALQEDVGTPAWLPCRAVHERVDETDTSDLAGKSGKQHLVLALMWYIGFS